MLACCCTLAGSAACRKCPRYIEYFGIQETNPWTDVQIPGFPRPVIFPNQDPVKIKRTIKKFDDKGNLIEEITEEQV